jgi:hypothetical protein
VALQWAWVTSILKCVVCYRWRFLWLDIYFRFFSSLIIWYLSFWKIKIFDLFLFHHDLPSLEDSSFARTWVLPSCVIFSPFVGCFVLLMIIGLHHSKAKLKFLEKTFHWCIIQFERCIAPHYQWQSTFLLVMVFNNSLLFISMSKSI